MTGIDIPKILKLAPSPAYVVDLGRLRHNLAILDEVQKRSGAKILMALKAFAMWSTFPMIRETLQGVCASSPWEAQLGRDKFGGEVHSFAAAFKESDIVELLSISDHLVFNSFNQLERFRPLWQKQQGRVSIGLRVNPEHSEGHTELYDPCAPNSRLGIKRREFDGKSLEGIEGLHFHTLCEHLFEPLARTAEVFEEKFGEFLPQLKWINFGGGHHITREGYDIDGLVELIRYFKEKYNLEVYLEPGEAVVIGTGLLVGEVLDVVPGEIETAILDVSATCHMPDILEMPYRPEIAGGYDAGDKPHTLSTRWPVMSGRRHHRRLVLRAGVGPWRPIGFSRYERTTQWLKPPPLTASSILHLCTYEPETGELQVVRSFVYEDFQGRIIINLVDRSATSAL